MALTYNQVDYRGKAAEPIIEEILFENDTIGKGLVTFEEDVKAETIFTEVSATATLQEYTCGEPTAAGALSAFDVVVTPKKAMFYDVFCPENLRFSRFKRDIKSGAWETLSDEFERVVIGGVYAKQVSLTFEREFWNGVTAATKSAVAALTAGTGQTAVGTAEKTLIAGLTASQIDGVVATMIYNDKNSTKVAGVGGRIKVAGTTITAANIKAEYDKIYAAIPAEVLESSEQPILYAPKSHKKLIVAANNVTTDYTKPFVKDADGYSFNDVRIVFVPLPENVVIAARKSHLFWCTDLIADIAQMKLDKLAANRDDMFIKNVMTLAAHVANQKFNVLYVG